MDTGTQDVSDQLVRLNVALQDVVRWGRETFPRSTLVTKAEHLRREVAEFDAQPLGDPEEMADVLMIMSHLHADLADIRMRVFKAADEQGVDLVQAVRAKLAICRARTWNEPDEQGVVEHVRV